MRYRQNNEFDLVFVVAYQRILQLSYMDKFLTSIEAAFRDKYKQQLMQVFIVHFTVAIYSDSFI